MEKNPNNLSVENIMNCVSNKWRNSEGNRKLKESRKRQKLLKTTRNFQGHNVERMLVKFKAHRTHRRQEKQENGGKPT